MFFIKNIGFPVGKIALKKQSEGVFNGVSSDLKPN